MSPELFLFPQSPPRPLEEHRLSSSRSVLSQCIHAVAALLYPFTWAHTYIPVVPECLLDTVCCPTPFMVGIQRRHLERVLEQPMEEVFIAGRRGGGVWLQCWVQL